MIKFKIKNLLILFLVITSYCLLITPVFAQWSDTGVEKETVDTSKKTTNLGQVIEDQGFFQRDIGVFISKGITAVITVAALLCLGYLLWGGIDWLTSEGDKEKYTSARNKIMHAILGLAIVVTVWAVWQLILFFLGLNKVFGL